MFPTLQDLGSWVHLEASPEDLQVKDDKILSGTESRNETDVTTSSTLPMEASIILVTVLVRTRIHLKSIRIRYLSTLKTF